MKAQLTQLVWLFVALFDQPYAFQNNYDGKAGMCSEGYGVPDEIYFCGGWHTTQIPEQSGSAKISDCRKITIFHRPRRNRITNGIYAANEAGDRKIKRDGK